MRAFNVKTELSLSPFKTEEQLRDFVEDNLESLFGIEYVSSEVIISGYKIDTLAFDPKSNSFVVIEYKKGKTPGLMEQGIAYLNECKKHVKSLVLEYINSTGKELKIGDICSDSTSLILVSQRFTNHQAHCAEILNKIRFVKVTRWQGRQEGETPLVTVETLSRSGPRTINECRKSDEMR